MSQTKRILAVLLLCLAFGGCADRDSGTDQIPPAASQPTSPTTLARAPSGAPGVVLPTASPRTPAAPQAQIFRGTGTSRFTPPTSAGPAIDVNQSGDITLNFVNTDVRDVLKTVLGDFLQLSYTVDPSIQGPITVQTSRPISRAAVLPVLEQTLRLSGIVVVQDGSLYKIIPAPDRGNSPGYSSLTGSGGSFGYGSEIVPLNYVSADEMLRVLEPISPPRSVSIADPTRNLLLVSGTAQERQSLIANIALFDVDWLKGMSFAMFTPRFADARTLARELGQVTGGKDGPLNKLVRIITIDRLNAVMAISPQVKYLEELRQWVERLDRPGDSIDRRIFVYRVQHGRAADLAGVLSRALGLTNASKPTTSPSGQADTGNSGYGNGGSTPSSRADTPPPPANPPQPQPSLPGPVGSDSVDVANLSDVRITADETNNSIVILANERDYATIETALAKLDVVPLQVLLEAVIAEVTLTNDLRYGVQYFFNQKNNQVVLTGSQTPAITPTLPGFSYIFSASNNIRIVLDALESVTHVNVISSPELMVLNNQTATLQVGDQVPIATQQAVSVIDSQAPLINSIQYRDTGIILKVTPRVNQGGQVMLDITQEVSDVATTTSSQLNSPTIQQRKIQSTVAVHDNETIALGGLIKNGSTRTRGGIPVLQDIPGIGNLFRNTKNNDSRTELLILITPHVIDSAERARTVSDELRAKLPAVQRLLKNSR